MAVYGSGVIAYGAESSRGEADKSTRWLFVEFSGQITDSSCAKYNNGNLSNMISLFDDRQNQCYASNTDGNHEPDWRCAYEE